MIHAVDSISFSGIRNLKPRKNVRKVLSSQNSLPKGLTKSPVRFNDQEEMDPLLLGSLGGVWYSTTGGALCLFFSNLLERSGS